MPDTTIRSDRAPRLRASLEVAASVATVAACIVLIWVGVTKRAPTAGAQRPAIKVPTEPVVLGGSPIRGSKGAKVAIIEYSDFQCPYCSQFSREILPVLEAEYVVTGKVLLAFRHLPLANHPLAPKAAEAAECAGRQGKFWEMHDRLFAVPMQLEEASLRDKAKATGVGLPDFESCLAGQASARVSDDLASAKALGIGGTPAFLLGTVAGEDSVRVRQVLTGARPVAEFRKAIDGLLEGKVAAR